MGLTRGVLMLAVAAVALLPASAVGDDAGVLRAVNAYMVGLDRAVDVVSKCARADGPSCLVRAGRGLRRTALAADARAAAAVKGDESDCVRRALGRYRAGLARYAALGTALERRQSRRARTIARQVGSTADLSCAAETTPPAAGAEEPAALPEDWGHVGECADRWNRKLSTVGGP